MRIYFFLLMILTPIAAGRLPAQPGSSVAEFLARTTDQSRITFRAGHQTLICEVARSQEKQRRGLAFRASLGQNECMAFVYAQSTIRTFHMKDTRIPLSIAFLDSSMRVLAVKNLRPLDDWPVSSEAPVRVVLEANLNWFKNAGVQAGILLVLARE